MIAPPDALERWFPAVCGDLDRPAVLGDPLCRVAAARAWAAALPGEGLVLVGPRPSLGARLLACGRRSQVARIAGSLPGAGRVLRWYSLPATGGSRVFVPAGSLRLLRAALPLLPAGRARSRLLGRALAGASRLGLTERLGLDELAVAFKGPPPPPRIPWMRRAGREVGAVALGVPGLFRKAIAQVTRPDGGVEALLKLSLTGPARARVRREARALRRLEALGLSALAPRLRAAGDLERGAWLAQEALSGRRSPDALGALHLAFQKRLCARTLETVPAERLDVLGRASTQLDDLQGRIDRARVDLLAELRQAVFQTLGDRGLRCSLAHGDFTPWNLLVEGGRLRAVDWESAEDLAPVPWDLIHFHLQTGVLVRRRPAGRLLAELDALLGGCARAFAVGAGVSTSELDLSLATYLLCVTVGDEHAHAIETPPFPQVAWLRETRLDLARRLLQRLAAARRALRRSST